MRIHEIPHRKQELRSLQASEPLDALREEDALLEAQLLSVKIDSLWLSATLLFDLRTALAPIPENTAILHLEQVQLFSWRPDLSRVQERDVHTFGPIAWNVILYEPKKLDETWGLTVGFVPDAYMDVLAGSAEFYLGFVPDLPDAPPDFTTESAQDISRGMPSWDSPIELTWRSAV